MSQESRDGTELGSTLPGVVYAVYLDFVKSAPVASLPVEVHLTKCSETEDKVFYRLVCIQTGEGIDGLMDLLLALFDHSEGTNGLVS